MIKQNTCFVTIGFEKWPGEEILNTKGIKISFVQLCFVLFLCFATSNHTLFQGNSSGAEHCWWHSYVFKSLHEKSTCLCSKLQNLSLKT